MQEGGEQRTCSPLPTTSDVCDDSNPSPSGTYVACGQHKKRERPESSSSISEKGSCNDSCASPQKRGCLDRLGSPNTLTVQQLIDAMQQEKLLSQRVIHAGVDTVNLKEECLQKFVKCGGVAILDDWLQECHRMKSGDESPKSKNLDDKLDELIAAILQALEGLPIDLEALKGCSIGKSVNQLRSYKNTEFHKKAKKLVDTWKKRVDYEMKQNKTQSDSSHVVNSESSSQQQPDGRVGKADEVVNESTETKPCSSNTQQDSPKSIKVDERPMASINKNEDDFNSFPCNFSVTNNLAIVEMGNPSGTTKSFPEDKTENTTPLQPQKSEGKSSRSGSGAKKSDSSNQASSVGVVTAKERANEYRKKLRSSSSSIAASNTNTHSNASHEVSTQNTAEAKATNSLIGKGKSENSISVADSLTSTKCHSLESTATAVNLHSSTIGSSDDSREHPTTVIPNDGIAISSSKIKENSGAMKFTPDDKVEDSVGAKDGSNLKNYKDSHNFELQETLQKTKESQGVLDSAEQKPKPSEENQGSLCDGSAICVQNAKSTKGDGPKENVDNVSDRSNTKQFGSLNGEVNETAVDERTRFKTSPVGQEKVLPSVNENHNGKPNYNGDTLSMKNYNDNSNEPPSQQTNFCRDTVVRIDFDLNESLSEDHFIQEISPFTATANTASLSKVSNPIAVTATTKGAIIPPDTLNKCDAGWKGSAGTTAFRPAEPLSKSEYSIERTNPSNQVRNVNNFDLNVADHDDTLENKTCLFGVRQGDFDLNSIGEDDETEISTISITKVPLSDKQPTPKPVMLEFDLNEGPGLDEALQEQVVLPASTTGYYGHSLNGQAKSGDLAIWPKSSSAPSVAPVSIPGCGRRELPSIRPMQVSSTIFQKPISSVMYSSQTSPFLGCGPIPTYTYNPVPLVTDPNILVPKMEISTTPSAQGVWSRHNSPGVRSPFVVNTESDPRGSSGLYTSGRPEQNIFSNNTGPSVVNYREVLSAQERLVNINAASTFEDQMRIFQQSGVPVTTLKRKETDFTTGLNQSSRY